MSTQLLSKARRWTPKIILTMVDQAIVAGVAFVLNLLLARDLSPTAYGAFAVAFSVFLFLSGIHNALIVEPMSVFGPAYDGQGFPTYLGRLIWVHLGLTITPSLIMAVGVMAFESAQLREAVWALALTTPMILLCWLLRRAYYVHTWPAKAAASSILYAAGLATALLTLRKTTEISSSTGFLVMAVGSVAASALAGLALRPRILPPRFLDMRSGVPAIVRQHWDYGRWPTIAATMSLLTIQVQTFALAALAGLEAAGAFRAMLVFISPMIQAATAVGILFLPLLAHEYYQGTPARVRAKGFLITASLTTVAVVYAAILAVFGGPLERLVYGGKYATSPWLIPILGLVPVLGALATGPSLVLRAVQVPRSLFIAAVTAAPVGVLSAVLLTPLWGVDGAAASLLVTYAASAGVTFYLYRIWGPRKSRLIHSGCRIQE